MFERGKHQLTSPAHSWTCRQTPRCDREHRLPWNQGSIWPKSSRAAMRTQQPYLRINMFVFMSSVCLTGSLVRAGLLTLRPNASSWNCRSWTTRPARDLLEGESFWTYWTEEKQRKHLAVQGILHNYFRLFYFIFEGAGSDSNSLFGQHGSVDKTAQMKSPVAMVMKMHMQIVFLHNLWQTCNL